MSTPHDFLDDSVQLEVDLTELDSFPEQFPSNSPIYKAEGPHYSPISLSPTPSVESSDTPLSPFSQVKYFYNIPKFQTGLDFSQISELAHRNLACNRHHSVLCKLCSHLSIFSNTPLPKSPKGPESTSQLPTQSLLTTPPALTASHPHCSTSH